MEPRDQPNNVTAIVETPPPERSVRVLLIDDDADFRESLALRLGDEGFAVDVASGGSAALEHLAASALPDVILLDWRMPEMSGLEVLRELRGRGIARPVIFLTVLTDNLYEEAALASGAIDFVDKSRRWSVLMRRIELVVEVGHALPDLIRLGSLELRFDINRARWAGRSLDLTLTEFRILTRLAMKPNEDVSYRDIYDLVHGKDFIAGQGPEGHRVNVRTFIKRIRSEFRSADSGFNQIQNYAGFGYRWIPDRAEIPPV
jgi:two-component system response regulator ChvI